jgi:hypothetical protein
VDCWINSTQVAPHHHRPAAAIASIDAITTPVIATVHRGRRSGAEKARGDDDGKHAESLFSVHGLLLLLAISRPCSLTGTSYSTMARAMAVCSSGAVRRARQSVVSQFEFSTS